MLYIRADMNKQIATGHIMRCLAIADAAKERGEDTTFILSDAQATEAILERGYSSIVLQTKWNHLEAELTTLQRVIEEQGIKVLLIDSYMVTQSYLQVLSQQVKVVYIDDLNAFFYPVHTLICYASYWRKHRYQERYTETNLLLGPQYTPLRAAFQDCSKKVIRKQVENLLLLSGGTDHFQLLEGILLAIETKKYQRIDVVCGKYFSDYEQICIRYQHLKNIHFHKAIHNIESYMRQADMAVSAGGTTLYELCACGTPTISYSFADNQLDNVIQFHEDHMIDYAGDIRETDIFQNIRQALDRYHNHFQERRQRSEKMQELIDGNGSGRIAVELIKLSQKQ